MSLLSEACCGLVANSSYPLWTVSPLLAKLRHQHFILLPHRQICKLKIILLSSLTGAPWHLAQSRATHRLPKKNWPTVFSFHKSSHGWPCDGNRTERWHLASVNQGGPEKLEECMLRTAAPKYIRVQPISACAANSAVCTEGTNVWPTP